MSNMTIKLMKNLCGILFYTNAIVAIIKFLILSPIMQSYAACQILHCKNSILLEKMDAPHS